MPERPPPRVVAVLPGLYASTIIGIAKPLLALHDAGRIRLDLSFQFLVRARQIDSADVLVLCHSIDPACAWILDRARDAGTPIVYEMDDNLLEPPEDVPGMAFLRDPARQQTLLRCLRQAALVRTYAPALTRFLEPLATNVVLVRGALDWRLVAQAAAPHRTDRVRIVYATGREQDSIGPMLIGPLRRVLDDYADVELTLWGPRLPGLSGHPRVHHRARIADYDRFFAEFAAAGFDIGLAPLPDDAFHRCKTNIKFREYAACRIAGIYSDTEVYRGSVIDGERGLLVPEREAAWVAALGRLIHDAGLRQRIRDQAYDYVRAQYPPGQMEECWAAHIHRVRAPSDDGRHVAVRSNAAAPHPSPGPLPMAVGIVRQAIRLAVRVPAVLRSLGIAAVWARTRAQLAHFHQLVAWEIALRRMRRE